MLQCATQPAFLLKCDGPSLRFLAIRLSESTASPATGRRTSITALRSAAPRNRRASAASLSILLFSVLASLSSWVPGLFHPGLPERGWGGNQEAEPLPLSNGAARDCFCRGKGPNHCSSRGWGWGGRREGIWKTQARAGGKKGLTRQGWRLVTAEGFGLGRSRSGLLPHPPK